MSEYKYNPQENITIEEIAAILDYMLNYSVFCDIPIGAERHFVEVTPQEEKGESIWMKVKGLFV